MVAERGRPSLDPERVRGSEESRAVYLPNLQQPLRLLLPCPMRRQGQDGKRSLLVRAADASPGGLQRNLPQHPHPTRRRLAFDLGDEKGILADFALAISRVSITVWLQHFRTSDLWILNRQGLADHDLAALGLG